MTVDKWFIRVAGFLLLVHGAVGASIVRAFRFFYGLGYVKLAELLRRPVQNGQVPALVG